MHSKPLLAWVTFANYKPNPVGTECLCLPLVSTGPEGVLSPRQDQGSWTSGKPCKLLPLSCKGIKSPANGIWRYHVNSGGTLCYKGVNRQSSTMSRVTTNKAMGNSRLISNKEAIQKLGFRSTSCILQHLCSSFFNRIFINRIFW